MRLLILLALLVATTAAAETPEEAIIEVMRAAEAGWNAGDHETYMACYVPSEDLRFASGGTVTRGWETTLARYRKRYPDATAMGTLVFSDLDVTVLADDAVHRWQAHAGAFSLGLEHPPLSDRIVGSD